MEHNVARDFDLAILAPATLKAPQLAHHLLKSDRAFAMLLPNDLLDCVALRKDGVVNDDVLLRMRAVRTVTLGLGTVLDYPRCRCPVGPLPLP